jgi:hypothetical protein
MAIAISKCIWYIYPLRPKMAQRLPGALSRIEAYFENSPDRVFTRVDLNTVLVNRRTEWQLPRNTTLKKFLEFILERTKLRKVVFSSQAYGSVDRFSWGDVSSFLLGLSLRRGSYLSHATAVFLHGLTEQLPKVIYVNHEQTPKPRPSGSLSQESLDRAFANRQGPGRWPVGRPQVDEEQKPRRAPARTL